MLLVCGMLCVRVMILNYSQEAAAELLRGQIIFRQNTDAVNSEARCEATVVSDQSFSPHMVC